jgi:hypothetical protein
MTDYLLFYVPAQEFFGPCEMLVLVRFRTCTSAIKVLRYTLFNCNPRHTRLAGEETAYNYF